MNGMDALSMMAAAENPQAEAAEGSPRTAEWWGPSGLDLAQEGLNSFHAANASCAAFQAEVAAKNAAQLAHWVQYLWGHIASLQTKVDELEDWKRRIMDDLNTLRFEHKKLRRGVMPEEFEGQLGLPAKAKSAPLMLSDHLDIAVGPANRSQKKVKTLTATPSKTLRPPPGLDFAVDAARSSEAHGSKQVRFVEVRSPDSTPKSQISPVHSEPPGEQIGASRSVSLASLVSTLTTATEASLYSSGDSAVEDGPLEGVQLTTVDVGGTRCAVAEWRIGHFSAKLRGCNGRPLVSPAFAACGLEGLRLMVYPEGKEAKGPRSRRQKELYTKKVTEGPLDGSLKLKVPDCPPPHVLEYYLKVGSVRAGPLRHNFSESTVNGSSDFGADWLQQVDADMSLTVAVEIVLATGAAASGAPATEGPGAAPAAVAAAN